MYRRNTTELSIDIVTKEKPNIVFILADDLGWTDLGVMGSDYYETPEYRPSCYRRNIV